MIFSVLIITIYSSSAFAWPWSFDGEWKISKSKISYAVTHPLHDCEGESSALSGKLNCKDKVCEVDLSIPVKSFVSRDAKKDTEMREVTKENIFPNARLIGRAKIMDDKVLMKDVQMTIAGKEFPVRDIEFTLESEWGKARVKGEFEFSLDQYQIRRPKLIEISIGDKVTMDIDVSLVK